jgi:hypothetical protein
VEYEIIQFSRLYLVDDLPRFVKALRGKSQVREIYVNGCHIRCKAQTLLQGLRGFLILPLRGVHVAQIAIRSVFPRVTLNHLLIRLRGFIQFSGYIQVVVGGDLQLFSLAGMFPQLECLGVVLAGPPYLAESLVVAAHCRVAHGKIRIKLDGSLMIRQGCGVAFLVTGLSAKAVCFQSFQR